MRLAEHTTTTAATALGDVDVAVLPVGSTEQHGPALPLGTDYMIAEAAAGELDALVDWLSDREFRSLLPEEHL